jgi:hypothetical protein
MADMTHRPCCIAALLLSLGLAAPAFASNALVSAYSNSNLDSYTIMGYNLNRVVEAEIRLDYKSDNSTPPVVSANFLDRKTKTFTSDDNGMSLTIKLVCVAPCKQPMSGNSPFAIVRFEGTVSSLSAVLRYEKGATESARVSITNPTTAQIEEKAAALREQERRDAEKARLEQERLAAEMAIREQERRDTEAARLEQERLAAAEKGAVAPSVESVRTSPAGSAAAGKSAATPSVEQVRTSAAGSAAGGSGGVLTVSDGSRSGGGAGADRNGGPTAAKPGTAKQLQEEGESAPPRSERASGAAPLQPPEDIDRPIAFSHRESILERFRARRGERASSDQARLFVRSDEIFSQEPPLLLSDGSSSLRLTVRLLTRTKNAPQFFISEASCTRLRVGQNDGVWELEILPRAGSLHASVSVLTGNELIDFPLAVAPPLELFDQSAAREGELDYVRAANELATAGAPGTAGI